MASTSEAHLYSAQGARQSGEIDQNGVTSAPSSEVQQSPFSRLFSNFIETTTAHGLPNIFSATSIAEKFFWLLAFLVCLAVFCYQVTKLAIDFASYPYTTKTDIVTSPSLEFPAVTICNVNMMRRSQLVDTRFEGLVDLDGDSTGATDDYSWWFGASYYERLQSDLQSSDTGGRRRRGVTIRELADMQRRKIVRRPNHRRRKRQTATVEPSSAFESSITESPSSSAEPPTESPSSEESQYPAPNQPGSQPSTSNESSTAISSQGESDISTGYGSSSSDVSSSGTYNQNLYQEFDFFASSWEDNEFDFDFYDYNWVGVEGDWEALYMQSRRSDFSDLKATLNPTTAELETLGHQAEDFILQCAFDRRSCSYTNFTTFQHGDYGNCFTFNGRATTDPTQKTMMTGRTGSQFGLHLTLFVEQPEYMGLFSPESGVKVSIHPSTEQPFPEDDGLTASTGQRTTVSLRQLNITRLGGRYGDRCTRTGENTNFTSHTFSYTTNACVKQCLQKTLQRSCGCITDIRFSNHTQCSSFNSTQERCRQLVEYLYYSNTLQCSCPIGCREISYQRSVSSSLWPSERYEEHLAAQLALINNKTVRILQDVERTRQNLVNLAVYFEQLNYELNLQVPVHSIESLFGDLGGLIGLYLGMSFLSFGEIIVLLVGFTRIFGAEVLCSSCRSTTARNSWSNDERNMKSHKHVSSTVRDGRSSVIKNDFEGGSRRSAWLWCLMVMTLICVLVVVGLIVAIVVLNEQGIISLNL